MNFRISCGKPFISQCSKVIVAGLLAFTLFPAATQAQNRKGSFLVGANADALWDLMGQAPYAQNGEHGFIIYMNSYSHCGNCIVFLRDFWEARKSKIQLREIFAPANTPQFLNEAADVSLSRSSADAEAYYKQTKVAPPANSSPARQAALQKELEFNTKLNAFFARMGHDRDGFPTFVLRHTEPNGERRVVVVTGWGSDFAKDLDKWIDEDAK